MAGQHKGDKKSKGGNTGKHQKGSGGGKHAKPKDPKPTEEQKKEGKEFAASILEDRFGKQKGKENELQFLRKKTRTSTRMLSTIWRNKHLRIHLA